MHSLLVHQLARVTHEGEVDLVGLLEMVDRAYLEADADRRRTDRAVLVMCEEMEQLNADLKNLAHHDALTGLANRGLFREVMTQQLAAAKRDGRSLVVFCIDFDRFKNVNDTLGHHGGDELLRQAAQRMRAAVREGDTLARVGGDEFLLLQSGAADPDKAAHFAERLIDTLSAPFFIQGQQTHIGASIGIALSPADGNEPEELLRNGDLALYRAKDEGRDTYRFFKPEMDGELRARRILEQDLRKAIVAEEFELYYQPFLDLARNQITGFEALIRWNHPVRGLVTPQSFIPLAEEIGLIVPIGEWVIREACRTAARWPSHLTMSVNISALQFRSPGLVQTVADALSESGLAASRLELEITETVLLSDKEATLSVLHQLRGRGVHIAVDDFGTGYSSFSYLRSFPFDKIKIDRSFVSDVVDNAGSLNIVRALAMLAKGMGMTSTAEGIETREQLESITAQGCTEMQGFLLSRPLPAAEIERVFLTDGGRQGIVRRAVAA
ncbi:MAG: EAL domain-containing protein [Devosia sp.]